MELEIDNPFGKILNDLVASSTYGNDWLATDYNMSEYVTNWWSVLDSIRSYRIEMNVWKCGACRGGQLVTN